MVMTMMITKMKKRRTTEKKPSRILILGASSVSRLVSKGTA